MFDLVDCRYEDDVSGYYVLSQISTYFIRILLWLLVEGKLCGYFVNYTFKLTL